MEKPYQKLKEKLGDALFQMANFCSAATVFKGIDSMNGTYVALKFIDLKSITKAKVSKSKYLQLFTFILNEIDTIQTIDHENVIQLLAYNLNVDNNGKIMLVFEYAQCGELYHFLAINRYFNHEIAKTYLEQILNALEVCHTMGIIHRDIKTLNIFLSNKMRVKVIFYIAISYR